MSLIERSKTVVEETKTTKKPDGAGEVTKTQTQTSLVGTLKNGAKPAPKKGLFSNPLVIIGVIFGALLLIGLLVALFAMGGDKPEPKKIEDGQTAASAPAAQTNVVASTVSITTTPTAPVDPTDFSVSLTPIETLATQSVEAAVSETPQYKQAGGTGFSYPNGQMIPLTDPLVVTAKQAATKRVVDVINTNGFLQQRSVNGVGQSNGQSSWFIKVPKQEGTENMPEYVPVTDPNASKLLKEGMKGQATSFLTEELDKVAQGANAAGQQTLAQQPVAQAVPVQAVPVQGVITQEEKQGYLDLISKQRMDNRELVRENKELKQKMQEQKQQIVNVLQKVEDNRYASNKLQATMIPQSTGFKVISVLGDRVWLENKNGELFSLTQGEKLPNTELKINDINSSTGVVLVTPSK
jgi:hypothetical protein